MRNKWEKVKAKVKLVLMVDDDDDQAPSEQDIEDALKILVSRKPELLEDSEGYNRTFRELRNELVPKIDEGITLTDQNSAWKPWLSDMQSSDTWETPRSDSYYVGRSTSRSTGSFQKRFDSRRRAVRKDPYLYRSDEQGR